MNQTSDLVQERHRKTANMIVMLAVLSALCVFAALLSLATGRGPVKILHASKTCASPAQCHPMEGKSESRIQE